MIYAASRVVSAAVSVAIVTLLTPRGQLLVWQSAMAAIRAGVPVSEKERAKRTTECKRERTRKRHERTQSER
jgi:hypothetical protein